MTLNRLLRAPYPARRSVACPAGKLVLAARIVIPSLGWSGLQIDSELDSAIGLQRSLTVTALEKLLFTHPS